MLVTSTWLENDLGCQWDFGLAGAHHVFRGETFRVSVVFTVREVPSLHSIIRRASRWIDQGGRIPKFTSKCRND